MHGADVVDVERLGVLNGAGRGQIEAVDHHQGHVAGQRTGLRRGFSRGLAEDLRLLAVSLVESDERKIRIGNRDEDRPRPFEELGHPEDDDDRKRGHRRGSR